MLPTKHSTQIMDLINSVATRYLHSTAAQQKQLGTDETRTEHYIQFCQNQLGLDPKLADLPKPIQTIIAIIYLAYLTEDHTHFGFRVRYPTLKGYMDAMVKYVYPHTGRNILLEPNPNVSETFWQTHPLIERIYQDTKDWQGMPNCQDPTTKAMRDDLCKISKDDHPDSHNNDIINWSTIAAANRYRGKEWCQEKNTGKNLNFTLYDKPTAKFDNRIYACCKDDFEFKSRKANGFLNLQKAAATPYKNLASIRFRWRYQKNKNHGEKIKFQATPDNTDDCPCYVGHQIAQRFVRLKAP